MFLSHRYLHVLSSFFLSPQFLFYETGGDPYILILWWSNKFIESCHMAFNISTLICKAQRYKEWKKENNQIYVKTLQGCKFLHWSKFKWTENCSVRSTFFPTNLSHNFGRHNSSFFSKFSNGCWFGFFTIFNTPLRLKIP